MWPGVLCKRGIHWALTASHLRWRHGWQGGGIIWVSHWLYEHLSIRSLALPPSVPPARISSYWALASMTGKSQAKSTQARGLRATAPQGLRPAGQWPSVHSSKRNRVVHFCAATPPPPVRFTHTISSRA